MAIDINTESYENEVIQSELPVVVDFWGPKCGPCLALMPAMLQLEEKYSGKMKLVKVDATQNRRLCMSTKVLSLPTFIFYKNNKEMERLSGNNLTIEDIETAVKKIIV